MALPTVNVTPGAGVTVNTLPNAGQATMANSLPVAIASDQALPLPTGAATSTKQPALGVAGTPSTDVLSVQGAAGTPLTTGGLSVRVGASFTTPAGTTAYSIGDLIANSGTAASVVPMTLAAARAVNTTGRIRRVRVKTADTGAAAQTVRVHFYEADPSASTGITNGDNGAYLTKEATWIGACDVILNQHFSDAEKGIGVSNIGTEIIFGPATGTQNLFALLEARSALTPQGAKLWTVVAEIMQD